MIDTYDNNLAIVIQQFIIDRKSQDLSKNTIRFYEVNLGKFAEYCDAQAISTLEQLTPNVIQEFLAYLKEKGNNTGGVVVYFRAIKAMLKWYWRYNQITGRINPIDYVKPPKKKDLIIDPVKDDQIEDLIATCKKNTFADMRDKAIIMLLADTGLRAQELCDIEQAHINDAKNLIFISADTIASVSNLVQS